MCCELAVYAPVWLGGSTWSRGEPAGMFIMVPLGNACTLVPSPCTWCGCTYPGGVPVREVYIGGGVSCPGTVYLGPA